MMTKGIRYTEEFKADAEQITLKNMERGKYFKVSSNVIVDGENLADMLVETWMAVRYDGWKKMKNWCE